MLPPTRPIEISHPRSAGAFVYRPLATAEAEGALRSSLAALLPRPQRMPIPEPALQASLQDCFERVTAWCKRAVAEGWDSGRLSAPVAGDRPFEREVAAVLDGKRGHCAAEVAQACERVTRTERAYRARWRTSRPGADAAGLSPLELLLHEFGLSELGADILLITAAPSLWGELARMYGIVANDPGRPLCDELLIGQILGPQRASPHEIARELSADSPLIQHGLVQVGAGVQPFAALSVPQILINRLRGHTIGPGLTRPALSLVPATRSLTELRVPQRVLDRLARILEQPPQEGALRLLVRGRTGSGRRTLLAALAEQANRVLAVIDLSLLLGDRRQAGELLRMYLREAAMQGCLPCITGVDTVPNEDAALREQLREVFRSHPGPLVFRCGAASTPPLDPRHECIELPALSETERGAAWEQSLQRHHLPSRLADDLAARYRLETGTIERICEHAAAGPIRLAPAALREAHARDAQARDPQVLQLQHAQDEQVRDSIDALVRQHRAEQLGSTAVRMTRLSSWSDLVLPVELSDSLLEFIGRVHYRRTVLQDWGFDQMATTTRGLTALFQGEPGTGKTLAAGVIARELGYELYRIDLGRVMSRWIGETEKNLGAAFDAAEEGDVILLFDEADSLFAKRTDVRSSIDRYSNIEVNYLLQRLDSFEGIAILTTNFGTAIDSAFKRRLSLRLVFPFPDEDLREQLWSAHLPPDLPIAGHLDLRALAERYELSGGYIRNAVLRAAFLAALEQQPVSQEYLERAVRLEYREMGKLIEGGRLD